MAANFIVKAEIIIDAPITQVWEALTNPELIKQYFFGAEAVSEWQVGSRLEFHGNREGKTYHDKGTILRLERPSLFQYTYFSAFTGLADAPENYMNVTYELNENAGKTRLTVKQENNSNEQLQQSAQKNWEHTLRKMKDIVEEDVALSHPRPK